jgi:dTDP-4-dehydrorhamnose 3,5-epimerase
MKSIQLIKYKKFRDERGYFFELYNKKKKIINNFKQINISQSKRGVIRGLHYQTRNPQAKLIIVLKGKIFDVCVDLRKNSKTFGKSFFYNLDHNKEYSLFVPEGFAHGFYSYSNDTLICYLTSDYYNPRFEKTLIWNDPNLNILWPHSKNIKISAKDKKGHFFQSNQKYF